MENEKIMVSKESLVNLLRFVSVLNEGCNNVLAVTEEKRTSLEGLERQQEKIADAIDAFVDDEGNPKPGSQVEWLLNEINEHLDTMDDYNEKLHDVLEREEAIKTAAALLLQADTVHLLRDIEVFKDKDGVVSFDKLTKELLDVVM